MLKNFLLSAIRNLVKHKFYSIINVFGLTVGIAVCIVILLFVNFEFSYDKYHEHADRIYRIDWELDLNGIHTAKAAVTPPMAEAILRKFPEVEAATRFRYFGAHHFKREDENISEWRVVYTDNDIFKIFSFPFMAGDPATALQEPYTMVISEKCAEQFFPNEDALGKTLMVNKRDLYKITGIIREIPENSHFHYRMFLSMEGLEESKNNNWIGGPYNTYVLLREDADPNEFQAKLPHLVENFLMPHAASVLGDVFIDGFKSGENKLSLQLRPLLDIHLHSHMQNELEANNDIAYVYLMILIAIFILIIAGINFVNLATARSATRAREVGIRKVIGSDRKLLIVQFIGESILLTGISVILALGLTEILLIEFSNIVGINLKIPWDQASFYFFIAISIITVGSAAGLYPAILLSGFQPVRVLKGTLTKAHSSFLLRSSLVVFQFFISIFMIIATIAIYQQMNFIKNKKLGFNKENILLIRDVYNIGNQLPAVKDEILKNHLLLGGTITSYLPGPGSARKTPLFWRHGADPTPENSINGETWTVDYDYIPTLGMEIIAGRNFSRDFPSDSSAVILNETAIRQLGLQEDPIGQRIDLLVDNEDGSQNFEKQETRTIIGIVKDFNFESLHQEVGPLGLFFGTDSKSFLVFRYKAENSQEVISHIKSVWNNMAPGEPFNYSFLNQDFERMYRTEQKISKLFTIFSSLAIFIACIGLFAMTAFTVQQRTKEIGIRKVMGASVQKIIQLLSFDISRLILLAFLMAVPAAWLAIRWYLQHYAYRTTIHPIVFIGAGVFVFILASATMLYQSIKAATTNPVNTFRTE